MTRGRPPRVSPRPDALIARRMSGPSRRLPVQARAGKRADIQPRRRRSWGLAVLLGLVAVAAITPGAQAQDFGRYGVSRGEGSDGPNGLAVLAAYLRSLGYTTLRSDRWRTTLAGQIDTVIWFRQDQELPDLADWAVLEEWLHASPSHVLLIVGRDHDAREALLESMVASASPEDRLAQRRRLARFRLTETELDPWASWPLAPGSAPPDVEPFAWMTVTPDPTSPGPAWTEFTPETWQDVDLTRLKLPHHHTITVGPWSEDYTAYPYLTVEGTPFVTWYESDDWTGSVVVVDNPAFLINQGLLQPEHRRLTADLMASIDEFRRDYSDTPDAPHRVLFLEQPFGPLKVEQRPERLPSGLEIFTTWPIGPVLLHLGVFGIAACAAAMIVLGRARSGRSDNRADFAEHLHALGRQLRQTGDVGYARARIAQYHQHVKRTPSDPT